MLQLVQNLSSGETRLVPLPRPAAAAGTVVIATRYSLVSLGTERMLVSFAQASLLSKARQQPAKVRQVLAKARTDGVMATLDAVRSKLDQPIPLGYCNVGTVLEVGRGVTSVRPGDRVVSNGPHAALVRVPETLCQRVPDGVPDQAAAFTVVGSIGLQGIRLAAPTLGEAFVVIGVGLIGLLTVQMLLANGCRVLAIDYDPAKLAMAQSWGAATCALAEGADPLEAARGFSAGRGVDGVLITASTTSSDPVRQAAQMCRKRGRIVLVGVTGLELDRADFYEKELSFQVSCSYGPGRYDPAYEEQAQDYPFGFVRWTEQRNFEAVLDLLAAGRLSVEAMISRVVPFESAPSLYAGLGEEKGALGILLDYPAEQAAAAPRTVALPAAAATTGQDRPGLALIGAGNYASRVLLPAFAKAGARFQTVVTSAGLSGSLLGSRNAIAESSTELDAVLARADIGACVIATRHDSHAAMAARCLAAGKDVFVEKPLAIDRDGLALVEQAYRARHDAGATVRLMVGFNRRWAPLVVAARALVQRQAGPKSVVMTMNAGAIPAEHWTQDPAVGGGRIIGEACHFIDLMRFLVAAPITGVIAQAMPRNSFERVTEDKAFLLLTFADGSHGAIHYLANGASTFPKERIEVFSGGHTLQIDNYRRLRVFGWPGGKDIRTWQQDKGQAACARAFHDALVQGRPSPIPPDEVFEVARFTLEAAEQLR